MKALPTTYAALNGLRKTLANEARFDYRINGDTEGNGKLWIERYETEECNQAWALVEFVEHPDGVRFNANFTENLNGKVKRNESLCFKCKDSGMATILLRNWLNEPTKQKEYKLMSEMADWAGL